MARPVKGSGETSCKIALDVHNDSRKRGALKIASCSVSSEHKCL